MMMMLRETVFIAILINSALAKTMDWRPSPFKESKSKRGKYEHAASSDERTRIQSANNLLKDPSLESFTFIHPLASAASEGGANSVRTPSRNIATLRFHSGTKTTKKLFKVKMSLPKILRSKQRKLRGNVLFPDNISSMSGECTWDLRRGNGRKILFVPKACVKMMAKMSVISLRDGKVFGVLIPKKNKQFGLKKRKITKNLVIVVYGKRMEALLRRLAVKKQATRLIVSTKKHTRKQK